MEKVFRCLRLAVAVAVFTESFGSYDVLHDVCNDAPPKPVDCSEPTLKFTFNIYLKKCLPAYVCGPAGTKNIFDTKKQCKRTCPIDEFCTMPRPYTSCRAGAEITTTWHLSPFTKTCVSATGCAFALADFETQRECQAACSKHTVCYQPSSEGKPLESAGSVWHFSREEQRCISTTSLEKNGNNFENKKECMETCPYGGHLDECKLPKNEGRDCLGQRKQLFFRYYHDTKSGMCRLFLYKGCEGNANNYLTRRGCEATCQVSSKSPEFKCAKYQRWPNDREHQLMDKIDEIYKSRTTKYLLCVCDRYFPFVISNLKL
ncbi:carboxypeptidase inhibitor SmCI-like [Ixodes scapularis]|uniref:carboxypeptidase inhibitor SmCI-like n=1 Tax=Ixodes scapularis TaxID=6945 RepID=UPI001A9E8A30|nr:carboxypeptidase inhibitor SmCI-like [Ixodes scapularis]